MLTVKDITKSYTTDNITTSVLDSVSLQVDKNDFTCVVGRSGSGKSTLLNIMSTLQKPDSGGVFYNGVNLVNVKNREIDKVRRTDFSIIFQSFHLFPYLTVFENVLLPFLSRIKPVGSSEKSMAVDIIKRVGLDGKENRLPGNLSGGEQQRVSIARALVKQPKILFADEPTGSLDIKTGKAIIELLKELNDDGLSIVMVTHALEYTSYANKIIQMEDGRINDSFLGKDMEAVSQV